VVTAQNIGYSASATLTPVTKLNIPAPPTLQQTVARTGQPADIAAAFFRALGRRFVCGKGNYSALHTGRWSNLAAWRQVSERVVDATTP
jgi:hypothetical protein